MGDRGKDVGQACPMDHRDCEGGGEIATPPCEYSGAIVGEVNTKNGQLYTRVYKRCRLGDGGACARRWPSTISEGVLFRLDRGEIKCRKR